MKPKYTRPRELNWGNAVDGSDYNGIPDPAQVVVSPKHRTTPIMDRCTFLLPPIRGPRACYRATDSVTDYDKLVSAGIRFPRLGVCELPPWHATHGALPSGFECAQASSEADYKRIKTSWTVGSSRAGAIRAALEVPWGQWPQPTLASSRYWRFMRVRFVAAAMATLSAKPRGKLYVVTLVSPGFFVRGGTLDPVLHSAKMWSERFRKHLNDAGLSRNGEFMIAGLDASYEENTTGKHTGYQFHFHAIVDERMMATIEALKARRAYRPTLWVLRPHHQVPVSDVAGALTYLVKSFWTNRSSTSADAPRSVVRNGSRLAPEQLVEALAWFHGQRFADMIHTYDFDMPGWAKNGGW